MSKWVHEEDTAFIRDEAGEIVAEAYTPESANLIVEVPEMVTLLRNMTHKDPRFWPFGEIRSELFAYYCRARKILCRIDGPKPEGD